MTSLAAYPTAVQIVRRLLGGGFFNSAGIGFALYVLAICYPGIKATPAALMDIRTGDVSMSAAGESSLKIAVPLLILGLLAFSRHNLADTIRRHSLFFSMFCVCIGVVILVSGITATNISAISQIAQLVLTALVFTLCIAFWHAPEPQIDCALAMAFGALASALAAAAIIQGFHDYRWVGLIHPNHYARYAYVALVLHSILMRKVSLPIFILCLAAAYMVSARTIMIGILLFYASFLLVTTSGVPLQIKLRRAMLSRFAWAFIAAPVLIVTTYLMVNGERLLARLANDFAVFDSDRGVLSGFTGRADSWNVFLDAMPSFVAFGFGFRSNRYGFHTVHSGVLSYFMDFGMMIGGLLLFAVTCRALYLIFKNGRSDRRAMLCGLAIATTLVIQCFEPDNFNIGFIGSFFFMLALAYTSPPTLHRKGVEQ